MPTRLLLIRHGATPASAADTFAGAADGPLSPEGERQAEALALRLSSEKIAAVYTSPLRRAAATAAAVAARHGLTPILTDALREISHGHWEGLTGAEVRERFPAEWAAWNADPLTYAPPGSPDAPPGSARSLPGETGLSVLARALPALRAIVERHAGGGGGAGGAGGTVAVVSHKATIRLAACALIGLDPRRYRDALALDPAGVCEVSFDGFARAKVVRWNEGGGG